MTNPNDANPSVPEPELTVLVETHRDEAGQYEPVLSVGACQRAVTRDELIAHALAVMEVVVRVTHDAAVVSGLVTDLGSPPKPAAHLVAVLREGREPVDARALSPLELHGGVNEELVPFIKVSVEGAGVGQWSVQDATRHAVYCLGAAFGVPLDNALFRLMAGEGDGVGQAVSAAFVAGLSQHMVALVPVAGDE